LDTSLANKAERRSAAGEFLRVGSIARPGPPARISWSCWRAPATNRSVRDAPPGGGKRWQVFLPTLVESERARQQPRALVFDRSGLLRRSEGCTRSTSRQLKARAVDIARNLENACREMVLPIRNRRPHRRHADLEAPRQRRDPPDSCSPRPRSSASAR